MSENADPIHRYSRADAIADGVLIDVSAVAREAGIRYPVALTAAVWERCVAVPPGVLFQDEAGRLWDVLWMLACAIRRGGSGPEVRFAVHVRNDNRERTPPLVRLQALCGPGDEGRVIAVLLTPPPRAQWLAPGAAVFPGVSQRALRTVVGAMACMAVFRCRAAASRSPRAAGG